MAIRDPADLLVVGGAMRSGTTLLHRLLDSHPRVQLMAFELRALRYADLTTWAHAAAVHRSFTSSLQCVRHTLSPPGPSLPLRHCAGTRTQRADNGGPHSPCFRCRAGGHQHAVRRRQVPGLRASVSALHPSAEYPLRVRLPGRARRGGLDRRADKAGVWPQRKWATKYDSVEKATDYWLNITQTMCDIQRLQTNALLVRYEDLVLRTAETIAIIARHLELPADGFDTRLPVASSIGRYRERLSQEQVEAIERRAGPMMEAWGYAPGRA